MNSFMNDHEKIIKRIKKSAISYLARYEVSEYQFKNTMMRKLSNFENELSEKIKIEIIKKIKKQMISSGYINDKRFAEMKSRSIRRQGGSARLIYSKLIVVPVLIPGTDVTCSGTCSSPPVNFQSFSSFS